MNESATKFVNYEEHFSNDGVSQGYLKSQASCAELGMDLKMAPIAYCRVVQLLLSCKPKNHKKGNLDDHTDTYTDDYTNDCADIETECESDWDESSISDDCISECFVNTKVLLKAKVNPKYFAL